MKEKLKVAGAFLKKHLSEWWDDLDEKPVPHFVTAAMTIVLYFVIKIAVTIAA